MSERATGRGELEQSYPPGTIVCLAALFDESNGMAVDDAANVLYVACQSRAVVMRVCLDTGEATVFAGDGIPGYNGDEIPAIQGRLKYPWDVAVSPSGEVYIADSGNHRVRKVDKDGYIHTVAGTGILGYDRDGCPATGARLNNPNGVEVDHLDNIYITDTDNNRIRVVSGADAIISTTAGTGHPGPGGDRGLAVLAQLRYPDSVSVDVDGNLLIGCSSEVPARRVSAADRTISSIPLRNDHLLDTTVDGRAIVLDPDGNLFRTSEYHVVVFQQPPGAADAIIVAGTYNEWGSDGDGGPAVDATLSGPWGLRLTMTGDLIISESGSGHLRKVMGAARAADTVRLRMGAAAVDRLSVVSGERVRFSWRVSAGGESVARSTTVMVDLPSEVEFVSAEPSVGVRVSSDGRRVTVPLGAVVAGPEGTAVAVTGKVTAASAGPMSVSAWAASATLDPETKRSARTAGVNATVNVIPATAALSFVEGKATPASVPAAITKDVTWQWTLKNEGPAAAQDTNIIAVLPAGVAYKSGDPAPSVDRQTLTWSLGAVNARALPVVRVTGTLEAPEPGEVVVNAQATSTTRDLQGRPIQTPPCPARVQVVADGALTFTGRPASETVVAGARGGAMWSWELVNTLGRDAHLVVTGYVPDGTLFRSASEQGICEDGQVIWDLGQVNAGQPRRATITVDIPPNLDAAQVVFTAETGEKSVAGVADPDGTDPDAADPHVTDQGAAVWPTLELPVAVERRAVLTLADCAADPEMVTAGVLTDVDFSWKVRNAGPSTTRTVRLVATLPLAMTFRDASPQATYEQTGRTVTWELGDLPPTVTDRAITLKTGVQPGEHDTEVALGALVSSPVPEPDGSPRQPQPVQVRVRPVQPVGLSRWRVFPERAAPGGHVAVAWKIVNADTKVAEDVTTTVKIPPGLTPVGDFLDRWNSGTGELTSLGGRLDAASTWWVTVIMKVDEGAAAGELKPSATVKVKDQKASDPCPATVKVADPGDPAPGVLWDVADDDVHVAAAGFGAVEHDGKAVGGIGGLFGGILGGVGGLFGWLLSGFSALLGLFGAAFSVLGGLVSLLGGCGGALPSSPNTSGNGPHPDIGHPDDDPPDNEEEEDKYKLARLRLSGTATPDPVVPGRQVAWEWTLTNSSKNTATSIAVTFALPTGTQFSRGGDGVTGYDKGAYWTTTRLGTGASKTIRVEADVLADATGVLEATASATSFRASPATHTQRTTTKAQVDLDLPAGQVTPDPAEAGQQVTYTWALTNQGPSVSRSTQICLTLPSEGLQNPAVTIDGHTTPITDNRACLTLPEPLLPAVRQMPIVLTATIADGATANIPVTTTVTADGAAPRTDTAIAELSTVKADLRLSGQALADPATPGLPVTYVWTLAITGDTQATEVALTANVPTDLTDLQPSTGGTVQGSTVHWAIGTIEGKQQFTGTVTATVPADATGGQLIPVTAQATATGLSDPLVSPPVSAALQACSHVTITGSAAPSPVRVGGTATYQWTLYNTGPSTVPDTRAQITLPQAMTLNTTTVNGQTITPTPYDGGYQVPLGVLPVSAPTSICMICTAGPQETGILTATATLPLPGDQNPVHGQAFTDLDGDAALTLTPLTIPESVEAGKDTILTWRITKTGQQVCCNPHLLLDLPGTLEVRDATVAGQPQDFDQICGQWIIMAGGLAPGASADVTVTIRPDARLGKGGHLPVTAWADAPTTARTDSATSILTVTTQSGPPTFTARPATGRAGDDVRVTWDLTNQGPSAAAGTLTLTPPAHLTLGQAHAGPAPVTANVTGNDHTYPLRELQPGQSVTFTVAAHLDPAAPAGPLKMPATVTLTDPAAVPVNGEITLTVTSATVPQVTTRTQPSPAVTDHTLTYVWDLSNPGPSTIAAGKTFTATITGTDVTLIACNGNGTLGTGTAAWTLPALQPGRQGTLTLIMRIGQTIPTVTHQIT